MPNDLPPGCEQLAHDVWRLVAITEPILLRWWASIRLTMAQLRLLIAIAASPGVTVSELAEQFGVRPPSITGLVDKLVGAGFACRREEAADRRTVHHHATEQGVAAIGELKREGRRFLGQIFERMPPAEREALAAGLAGFFRASDQVASSDLEPALTTTAIPAGDQVS